MTTPVLDYRSADSMMSLGRARSVVPDALSFPRATMRELVRGRYLIDKLRFELDADGRGEVLYQLTGGGRVFHFFLVSDLLPEDRKTDRNFAASWDAMGVLCQGEWTAQREALLRREVPKQRAGFADYDTLVYARGNRSTRLFEHVVDSLAQGQQPTLEVLAPIGYILRTTAFIANGQLGTRELDGYDDDHPLRRPYHAQFCSAFMLREYVFDLVDHLARIRNPGAAVRLAPAYRRFIGLGNSAATGLAAYATNHPHQMHQWSLLHEEALVEAVRRRPMLTAAAATTFVALLDKAIRHFDEGARASDGVFAPPQETAKELRRVKDHLLVKDRLLAEQASATDQSGRRDEKTISLPALIEWTRSNASTEAVEVLHALVLDTHPDIAASAQEKFRVEEDAGLDPVMTVGALLNLVRDRFFWAIDEDDHQDDTYYFWYRCSSAPRDVRRGVRRRLTHLEFETNMDFSLRLRETCQLLGALPPHWTIATVLGERPALRHTVARIQALASARYSALRQPWLSRTYSPFEAIRFVLAFYGMEKFEAAFPKSVRGTFMQGAPIAEDVRDGRDGSWPFTLKPDPAHAGNVVELAPLPSTAGVAMTVSARDVSIEPTVRRLGPRELARSVQTALQGHGMPLGVAEEAGVLVTFAQHRGSPAVRTALRHCADHRVAHCVIPGTEGAWPEEDEPLILNAHHASALAFAATALDLAIARCTQSGSGTGTVLVVAAQDAWLLRALTLRGARSGMTTLVIWRSACASGGGEDLDGCGFALTHPGERAIAYVEGPVVGSGEGVAEEFAGSPKWTTLQGPGFLIVCLRPETRHAPQPMGSLNVCTEADLATDAARQGVEVSRLDYDALLEAGKALLVPQAVEHFVLHEGNDPLKSF